MSADVAGRPVTLLTLQWTDLELAEVCRLAESWGYDGLELACHPRHLDLRRAGDPSYLREVRATLRRHGLRVHALAAHMIGQAVCDPIDDRHRGIVPPWVWGDGDAEGVRRRAAEAMRAAAQAAAWLEARTVVGFTGSSIWPMFLRFPPVSEARIAAGFGDFARRWTPILDAFDQVGVRFALEVHPGEIAYDYWTARRALEAVQGHPAFGFNLDPSHFVWQGLDPAVFAGDFRDVLLHVDFKDTRLALDGRNGRLGSHLPWADPRRGWDFVSVGHGEVDFEAIVRVLNAIGYTGPISVEWEDAGMDREAAAAEALTRVRALLRVVPGARDGEGR
ncbi:sugar phosphate isomerase/epimerase family protein [Actinomadura flavalba]|uniref:sugar phosphate isomerase/epimerase family protein n=1 Tax=Actinomadura flavalba TaxID=1120938 RepID=UPI00036FC1A8|nr:sugar phosphate isomerase/epimerase [Actinomadura flavalba]